MPTLPHDVSDLHLAPVVLALDARLDELGAHDLERLAVAVDLASNSLGLTRDQREAGLLEAVAHIIDCHGWTLTWDMRGIRLTHEKHSLVLGAPPTFADYLAGTSGATDPGSTV